MSEQRVPSDEAVSRIADRVMRIGFWRGSFDREGGNKAVFDPSAQPEAEKFIRSLFAEPTP